MLEPRLRIGVATERPLVVGTVRHLLLEAPQLLLERQQVLGAREDVLAQREAQIARWSLVVERDARSLRERELPALE
jgi:hypothetical protein